MAVESKAKWGASYRLIAAEKWKAKSATMGRAVTEALVEHARPQPGMKVLDVATGTGEPGISLASRVGPAGHVTALDLSSELLEIAEQRARNRGLTNFLARQGDVHALPFPDQTFDLATCRFGVMFFASPEKALAEVHRVLKPGGRACFLAWGPFEQPYWLSTMGVVAKHIGAPPITPGGENPFKFAQPGSLSAVLRGCGFDIAEEETKTLPWTWPGSVEEVWEYARSVSAPFRPLLERVSNHQWAGINQDVHAAVSQYSDGQSVKFGVTVVLASGQKA